MKKAISVLLAMGLTVSMVAGCGSDNGAASNADQTTGNQTAATEAGADNAQAEAGEGISASDIKVGVIYIGDENEGYTAAHMAGIDEMAANLGLSDDQIIEKTLIPEDESAYDAAGEYPDIQFCHATGYQAASSGLSNMHNYFDSIYEARYVSGVVAGMKLNEMIENGDITAEEAKIGYVGAFPYAEVISGFTSFYLGARSVCESATMEVQYTNSWADMAGEAEVASQLIANGCVLISQHADTTGAPTACETAKVPCVGYNVDMTSVAPDAALTSPTNNWGVYYTHAVQCVLDGTPIETDWCQGFAEDAVRITPVNEAVAAEGTDAKVEEVEAALKDGSLHVFDTTTFTVDGGKTLEDAIAEGGDYAKYADYVSDGYYHESELASAPSFDIIIDGITSKTN